ncbi:hypothetical protein [Mycobacterium sp. PSTR-4-N]|uniref:hypothetical protein n=1 Tax=Mycobacterium sp. PSTR-4-N TaxID=2917745 RepID=UPI001F15005A|nr:hypothetical protein [Mycobacterium sp. PSTR-4-N]MCG7597406.1 hypothetical protein [Mycobacterium sp. PSTR-4-N]
MMGTAKFMIGSVLSGTALAMTGAGVAAAQPASENVNVTVDAVIIRENTSPGDAARISAAICGDSPAEVTAMARTVDTTGAPQTVCDVPGGAVVLTKYGQNDGNVPANPGHGAQAPAPPAGGAPGPAAPAPNPPSGH